MSPGRITCFSDERRRWRMQRGVKGAAVGIIEEKREPEDYSGNRNPEGRWFKSFLRNHRNTVAVWLRCFLMFSEIFVQHTWVLSSLAKLRLLKHKSLYVKIENQKEMEATNKIFNNI